MRVIFEEHSNKHGLTPEDIIYAAEHMIESDEMRYKGGWYMRFTGRHDDALMPAIGVVLKIKNGCLHVYHAGPGTDAFWNLPFEEWVEKTKRRTRNKKR